MKKIVTGLTAMTIAASGLLAFTPAHAMLFYFQSRDNYYSDAGFSNLVGQYQTNCDSSTSGWGTISEYSYVEYGNC